MDHEAIQKGNAVRVTCLRTEKRLEAYKKRVEKSLWVVPLSVGYFLALLEVKDIVVLTTQAQLRRPSHSARPLSTFVAGLQRHCHPDRDVRAGFASVLYSLSDPSLA